MIRFFEISWALDTLNPSFFCLKAYRHLYASMNDCHYFFIIRNQRSVFKWWRCMYRKQEKKRMKRVHEWKAEKSRVYCWQQPCMNLTYFVTCFLWTQCIHALSINPSFCILCNAVPQKASYICTCCHAVSRCTTTLTKYSNGWHCSTHTHKVLVLYVFKWKSGKRKILHTVRQAGRQAGSEFEMLASCI